MFGKKNNAGSVGDKCDSEASENRTYSLESVMALQKALERGLEQEEVILQNRYLGAKHADTTGQVTPLSLIQRPTCLLAGSIGKLKYLLNCILRGRKQPQRTSAR